MYRTRKNTRVKHNPDNSCSIVAGTQELQIPDVQFNALFERVDQQRAAILKLCQDIEDLEVLLDDDNGDALYEQAKTFATQIKSLV